MGEDFVASEIIEIVFSENSGVTVGGRKIGYVIFLVFIKVIAVNIAVFSYVENDVFKSKADISVNIKLFFDVADEYERLLLAHRSMSNAVVYSAIELTDAQKSALKARLEKLCGKSVSMSFVIDKSIMGGLYIDIDGSILDGSIRHRLHEVKEVIDK